MPNTKDPDLFELFFEEKGFLDERKELNDLGRKFLAKLLRHLPPIHQGRWGEAYVPMINKMVGVCTDLAVVRDGKVLLKYRNDQYYEGWEAPGGGYGPRETWEQSAYRHAEQEFGMKVRFVRVLAYFTNPDNKRAHDVTFLLLCEPESEPREGQWFDYCPENMVLEHQKYRPVIDQHLRFKRESE